jgi:hypothetical protein
MDGLVLSVGSVGVVGGPLLKNGLIRFDKMCLGKLSLINGQPAAFLSIINNAR